ncbi:type III secretion system export apparatus subunit SctR [Lujinxingia vulgaris]|nr:type III secretion system export apparatus subunit SctR [Lujinxingia vulgaris]
MSLRFIAPLIAAIAMLAPALASAEPVAGPLPPTGGSPLALTALLAGMALLPFALILVTSFVKVAVVLSILRTAIGAQQVPPNTVITGLAILLSIYIMAPVGHDIFTELRPHIDAYEAGELQVNFSSMEEAGQAGAAPLRAFLMRHADPEDRLLLHELAIELRPPEQHKNVAAEDLLVVVPAFVITELKEAFTIGFILFVPFIIVDLVVANILLSLGMHMLSPTTVSLPFKLLLFVLVDGWYLVVKGLILGYV